MHRARARTHTQAIRECSVESEDPVEELRQYSNNTAGTGSLSASKFRKWMKEWGEELPNVGHDALLKMFGDHR